LKILTGGERGGVAIKIVEIGLYGVLEVLRFKA